MSVVLVGKTPSANILVTDAIVTDAVDQTGDRFRLYDKIGKLTESETFYSLIGDETVRMCINYLDSWAYNKRIYVDFAERSIMESVIKLTEKFQNVLVEKYPAERLVQDAIVYFVNKENAFFYIISRTGMKYTIKDFRYLSEDEFILNYGGEINYIKLKGNSGDYLENAIQLIEVEHARRKQLHLPHLKYDFVGRFSGVMLTDKGVKEIRSPYLYASDMIAANFNDWDLLTDSSFVWSPF